MLHLFKQWEREKLESNDVLCDSSNWDCVANLQKILKMSIGILRRFALKRASLHHGYKCGLERKLFFSTKNIRTYDYIGDSREGIIANRLNSCTRTSWCNTAKMNRLMGGGSEKTSSVGISERTRPIHRGFWQIGGGFLRGGLRLALTLQRRTSGSS